ncbi:MAG: SH3 domain-containing protein [Anaerolineae bacterium]|nr:SH3 domain-containing protein [Anaerolineae bacterium]
MLCALMMVAGLEPRLLAQPGVCQSTPGGSVNVNMRAGPGTNYPRADTLAVGTQADVTGQRDGSDGFLWYRTFSGGWVRSDVVRLSGDCAVIESVNPPPDYCTTREELSERPQLSGTEQRIGTERFVVHYTLEGADATSLNTAQLAAEILEQSLSIQVDELGWPMTPPDCGEGGDERFDLYIHDLGDSALGYAVPNHIIGDNPNSPEVEQYAAYGHLEITADFSPYTSNPADLMKATIAHEVHHNIQFTYDVNDAFDGLDEAGAVWMETQVYPEAQDAMQYLPDYFTYPDMCLGYGMGTEELGRRSYGEWVILDALVQDYGAAVLPGVVWRWRADAENMDSFYRAMDQLGTNAATVIERGVTAALLRDFTLALEAMDKVYIDAVVIGPGTYRPFRDGVQELGIDVVLLDALQPYQFTVDNSRLYMTLIGIDRAAGTATIYQLSNSAAVDTSVYDAAYLLIQNLQTHSDDEDCTYLDWTLTVTPAAGNFTSPERIDDASQFEPAMQLRGVERYTGIMDDYYDVVSYRLHDLKAGDVVQVYAGVITGDLDPVVGLVAINSTATEALARDDDGGGGLNSFLTYTIETPGDYQVFMTPIVNLTADAEYEVIIGINEPVQIPGR